MSFCEQDLYVQAPIACLDETQLETNEDTNLLNLKEFNDSLEDLVKKFEHNLNSCLEVNNYKTFDLTKLAPVQMRSEEEAMSGSQIFYTLTGDFGTLLPIDWSKSFDTKRDETNNNNNSYCKISRNNFFDEPFILTAEQVLNEIDLIIKDDNNCSYNDMAITSPDSGCFSYLTCDGDDDYLKYLDTLEITHEHESLKNLSNQSLLDLISSLEQSTQNLSKELIKEYALKDEYECENETKDTFITLVHSIQEKRKNFLTQNLCKTKIKKRKSCNDISNMPGINLLTTVPFNENIELNTDNLNMLNTLLNAIDNDSNQVSELLTNYILNVVCL